LQNLQSPSYSVIYMLGFKPLEVIVAAADQDAVALPTRMRTTVAGQIISP